MTMTVERPNSGSKILDPTREATRLPRGEGTKAQLAADRAARFAPKPAPVETAMAVPVEEKAVSALAYNTGSNPVIVRRLLAVEAENFLLQADIRTLFARIAQLEKK